VPATKSTPKRYTQLQLTKIFVQQGNLPMAETSDYQRAWWMNPTDANSLRLTLQGLQFVKAVLKIQSYEFVLPDELTNHNLLQLERSFKGMYYLLKRHKIILFEEEEALMLTLHGSDLKTYLDNLESQG
jgi:hypothetical protein